MCIVHPCSSKESSEVSVMMTVRSVVESRMVAGAVAVCMDKNGDGTVSRGCDGGELTIHESLHANRSMQNVQRDALDKEASV